ncbi:MAG: molecular chaperone DnaK [Actinobacteria bacterium]|nr:molecular chaperone DnaK [Actinomycetota bacterium]MCG2795377.1 molecular chaperone DnaK [Actinomycetes bacterium]
MSIALGIDLGTTNSVAAIMQDGQPVVIPCCEGNRLIPSVVAFSTGGRRIVGRMAKCQAVANPEGTAISVKRKMGTGTKLSLHSGEYTPQEISAMILGKIKSDVEAYLETEVSGAVITVPAYFNDGQRHATREAGQIAGFEVMRILNEPTAACLAYRLDREGAQTVLVWDLGGGTFDVSIIELNGEVFQVRAVGGDTRLGGDDYDQRIVEYMLERFRRERGIDLGEDKVALQRLKEAAERLKVNLSRSLVSRITLPSIVSGSEGSGHLDFTLTREEIQDLTSDLVRRMIPPTRRALSDARLTPGQVDTGILVGGATRMPAVKDALRDLLEKEPLASENPDEIVALGAAVQAGILTGQTSKKVLVDVVPLSLGIETLGGIFSRIIERNTPIPTSESLIVTNAEDNQVEVEVHVLQGERAMAGDNIALGKFQLQGVQPAARGSARVEVAFEVDVDGILGVSAEDLYSGNGERLGVSSTRGLDPEEIERMVKDAAVYAEEDARMREEVETHIYADNVIRGAEMSLERADIESEASLAEEVESALIDLKRAITGGDRDEISRLAGVLESCARPLLKSACR